MPLQSWRSDGLGSVTTMMLLLLLGRCCFNAVKLESKAAAAAATDDDDDAHVLSALLLFCVSNPSQARPLGELAEVPHHNHCVCVVFVNPTPESICVHEMR